jgi:putative RNA 2'-phosphotransferase
MSRLPRQLEALARMLTYMLGHRPDEFGLVLSQDGAIPIKKLLAALTGEPGWGFVRRHHLEEVAALFSPRRFEIQGDLFRILPPGPPLLRRPLPEPPSALLYLAVPLKAQARVAEEGLKPPSGQELLLAATPELALKLGRRRGAAVLVTVRAQAAAKSGVSFQGYGESLFLAGAIPREFLQVPALPREPEKPKPPRAPQPQPAPGSLILELPQVLQGLPKGPRRRGEPAWKTGARALRRGEKRGKGERGKGGNE